MANFDTTIPNGFLFGSSCFGLRSENQKKDDFSILFCEKPCTVSFVSTKNIFCGEPVKLAREKFSIEKKYRALAVNVGQANVGTGEKGRATAEKIVEKSAGKLGISADEIFSLSTGVIGQEIDSEKIFNGIEKKFPLLQNSAEKFAKGIMSTDTVPKTFGKRTKNFSIFGIAKGIGMLEPNMGTMLSMVVTDAKIEPNIQQKIWKKVVEKSYNCVSVDTDTSTSDMAFLFSSGERETDEKILEEFEKNLLEVCQNLAQQIAKDGEGATKLMEVKILNAESEKNAKIFAKSVVNSPLWKAAIFGADPNWGRILMALGKTEIPFSPEKISISLQDIFLFKEGEIQNFSEKQVSEKMQSSEKVSVVCDMQTGSESSTVWGCDLSYEYVKINAEYTT